MLVNACVLIIVETHYVKAFVFLRFIYGPKLNHFEIGVLHYLQVDFLDAALVQLVDSLCLLVHVVGKVLADVGVGRALVCEVAEFLAADALVKF